MIVIEGPDCVGKTTLAQSLVKWACEHGSPHTYQHTSRLPSRWDYYWDFLPFIHPYVVMDRFHMGNLVYQALDGTGSLQCPQYYKMLDAHIRLNAGIVIVVTMDREQLREQLIKDKRQQQFSPSLILKANEMYKEIRNIYPFVQVDYTYHIKGEFPGEEFISYLMSTYITDLTTWEIVQKRRPPWFATG